MAAGIPDELFWRSTPHEAGLLYEELSAIERSRRREAALRAGHIVAMIHNRFRSKKEEVMKPTDLLRGEKDEDADRLSPEEALQYMRAWAEARNQKVH